MEKIKKATEGNGVNIICEMLANVNLANDLGILARNGRVIIIGSRGQVQIDPRMLMMNDSTISGMTLRNASETELAEIHNELITGLANGALSPVIGKKIRLAEAAGAHAAIMEQGAGGKIVLVP
jgi:NADPH:quinone reductase